VRIGTPLCNLARRDAAALARMAPLYRRRRHMTLPDARDGGMHVILHLDAQPEDCIGACLQALLLSRLLSEVGACICVSACPRTPAVSLPPALLSSSGRPFLPINRIHFVCYLEGRT
jgi:hypothetical protein